MARWAKVGILLLAAIGCLAAWKVSSFHQPAVAARPFDRLAWLAGSEVAGGIGDNGCVRGGMGLDLLARNRLKGMSAEEVASLLGIPMRYALSGYTLLVSALDLGGMTVA